MQRQILVSACAILLASTMLATSQTLPSAEELEKVAEAMGSLAADFQSCNGDNYARQVRSDFRELASACTETSGEKNEAVYAFRMAFANRLNEVAVRGGECRGSNQSRYEVVEEMIEDGIAECTGE